MKTWGLTIKPGSRSLLSPVMSVEWVSEKWPRAESAEVLGHVVSADASIWPCWRKTHKAMWAAFWGNCVGPRTNGLTVSQRCALMDRSVAPVLRFRNTRWPWTKTLADTQNRTQRQMLAQFVRTERWPLEDSVNYSRRRMRSIATLARMHGAWGLEHAERVVNWSDHLQRERNQLSLAAQLYAWRGAAWLQERRVESSSGRPGTRQYSGYAQRRWDEAVEDAKVAMT